MKQYLELVRDVIENGTLQGNRTGVRTISLPGAMLRFDLQKGFPAITTRRLAFKSAIGEMVGFLRGVKNAGEFRELGEAQNAVAFGKDLLQEFCGFPVPEQGGPGMQAAIGRHLIVLDLLPGRD